MSVAGPILAFFISHSQSCLLWMEDKISLVSHSAFLPKRASKLLCAVESKIPITVRTLARYIIMASERNWCRLRSHRRTLLAHTSPQHPRAWRCPNSSWHDSEHETWRGTILLAWNILPHCRTIILIQCELSVREIRIRSKKRSCTKKPPTVSQADLTFYFLGNKKVLWSRMLPDHIYRNYYNELCGECEQVTVNKGQRRWVGWLRAMRQTTLWELHGKLVWNLRGAYFCSVCKAECTHCQDLIFHKKCLRQHTNSCNTLSRATRKLEKASELLRNKESELQRAIRRVQELRDEIQSVTTAQANAEAGLRQARAHNRRRG